MKRIYEPRAYGPEPIKHGFWQTTIETLDQPALQGTHQTDVAIIGGGFTGLNAALHLAEDGIDVTLLDAETIGWGASGRNGGFCCLGGGILDDKQIDKVHGRDARRDWRTAEKDAIAHVASLLERFKIDADTHSNGETLLAHKPKCITTLEHHAQEVTENYGVEPILIPQSELANLGLSGPFHGALTIPIGFGLNPLKYALGIARAAINAGARLYAYSPVTRIEQGARFTLHTPQGKLTAKRLIIATNGYSSEDIPDWLAARYLPVQSSVLVTRPLSDNELNAAGWTSDQMAFDSRNLLHYFRLMPDRRFLFGMRGGIFANKRADAKIKRLIRADFEDMFSAWKHVDAPHLWSGLVCMNAKGAPFTGQIPEMPGAFASLSYHGNGVAMASYCGTLLADLVQDKPPRYPYPDVLKSIPARIPLGSKRRWLLPPIYTGMGIVDR
ncbi:MAG: FAD-dependent oxidoreductase [Planktotalea sp.]|mgnify:FL=1|jgi:glycine/D-amino acid oxidase-like deaminating enzyme|uniref:NAD(P)/FAD-dependent oxidoreductase n=1 Tax=Planktotalea sp. TaxID=2029877 RepID=UPI000EEC82D2|nr:FAD-dependent oxidoreductase [Planktotalea sp.]MBT5822932.1 FAD-dependent oxidoreductase [Paracoccaceae bacterium]MDG1078033.1 FAD-dependent oxidoreductase [Planktotalea sp.]HCW85710.1 FAD-dependent oxidoreductase [Paracoccaceae bacterium]